MTVGSRLHEGLLVEVERLGPEDQLYLLEYLAMLVRRRLREPVRRALLELQGLGKGVWEGIDAQEYVDRERESWSG